MVFSHRDATHSRVLLEEERLFAVYVPYQVIGRDSCREGNFRERWLFSFSGPQRESCAAFRAGF